MSYRMVCKTLALTLDSEGRAVSLMHRGEGLELLAAGAPPTGLWQAGLSRPAEWNDPLPPVRIPETSHADCETWVNRNEYRPDLELDADRAPTPEIRRVDDTLRLEWRVPAPGGEAVVVLNVTGGEKADRLVFNAAFTAPSGWMVQRATFPRIRGFGDPGVPKLDALLYPENWGVFRRNPLEDKTDFTGQYPSGRNWAQMSAWFHGIAGLYLGIRDPQTHHTGIDAQYVEGAEAAPWNTERWQIEKGTATWTDDDALLIDRLAAGRRPAMQFRCNHWPHQTQAWTCPYPVVLEGFTGGWFEAGQIHRAWATRQRWCRRGRLAERKDASETLAKLDLWFIRYGFPPYSQTPAPAWAFRDAMSKLRDFFGLPFGIHWYHWHRFSWHGSFPRHAPVVEGFEDVKEELQRQGVVVMPYCQGRLLYRDRPGFEDERSHADIQANGQPYLERYTKQDDWPLALCPGDEWSRAQWYEAARMLWRDYGVDGVYFDQITAMPPSLCYHAGHGHPLGGGTHYWDGYDRALEKMAPLVSEDPRRFLSSELLSDAFMDRIDLYLSFVPPIEQYVPLFAAIYSGYTTIMGRCAPPAVMEDLQIFAICQGEQLLFGGQLGWVGDDILSYPQAAGYLRDLARLRGRVREILHVGTLERPWICRIEGNPLDITLPAALCGKARPVRLSREAARHTVWRAPDGRFLVLLLNETTEEIRVSFEPPAGVAKGPWRLWRCGLDEPEAISRAGTLHLTLPGLGVAALVSDEESSESGDEKS